MSIWKKLSEKKPLIMMHAGYYFLGMGTAFFAVSTFHGEVSLPELGLFLMLCGYIVAHDAERRTDER